MKVRVNITLKPSVLDPQGQAIANSLSGQGFNNIKKKAGLISTVADTESIVKLNEEIINRRVK